MFSHRRASSGNTLTHTTHHVRVLDDFGDKLGSGDVISGDLVQVRRSL